MGVGEVILRIYVTHFAAILAGVVNSAFCKSKLLSALKKPIDHKKNFVDGKRIFGNHKTWKGLLGYVLLNIIFTVIVGLIYKLTNISHLSFAYELHENTILFNVWFGFLTGLAWALFELPNSFIKRRLSIKPGKNPEGWKRIFFIIFDQADSIFGICLVLCMFYPMSVGLYFFYVFVGSATHIIFNMLLYFVGLRKNMF